MNNATPMISDFGRSAERPTLQLPVFTGMTVQIISHTASCEATDSFSVTQQADGAPLQNKA
ncbi:MAG: hypothetical protein ACE5D6_04370 [Candidatus Zixiibacteriota bacterium]